MWKKWGGNKGHLNKAHQQHFLKMGGEEQMSRKKGIPVSQGLFMSKGRETLKKAKKSIRKIKTGKKKKNILL